MNSTSSVSRDLKNKAYFDLWAKTYDFGRLSPWFQYTQELAIQHLDPKPGAKVLDVGCGTGFAVLHLASRSFIRKACGIDISSVMVEKARAKVPQYLRQKAEFRQASSESIPYAARKFDYILCTNSFHHYIDPLSVLAEMRRVLRPGGQVVILENAPDLSWYTWAWDYILRMIEKGHVRYYTSSELGQMLRGAGFESTKLCHLKSDVLKHGKLFASLQVWSGMKPLIDKSR